MNIVLVGLGLIGGSVAKALKQNTSHRVLGMDVNEDVLLDACSSGAIDGKASLADVESADLVYLSVCPAVWKTAETRVHSHRRLRHQTRDLPRGGSAFPR